VVRNKEFPRGLGKNNSFSALKYFYIKKFQNLTGKNSRPVWYFKPFPIIYNLIIMYKEVNF